MILVIDNYDSFIYNIVQYIGEYYKDVQVFRNDRLSVELALAMKPDGIVISPGPGRPEDGGISLELIKNAGNIPLLGVCLGHQSICQAFGGKIVQAQKIMHGKSSVMTHNGKGIFAGITNPIKGIRYHSLVAERESFPDSLEITCESDDGEIMGVQAKTRPVYGIQFHPESILTEEGKKIIKNFVDIVSERESIHIGKRIRKLIEKVSNKNSLSQDEAEEMMTIIMRGQAEKSQIAAYLMALKMKGESSDEITGSSRAMFSVARRVKTYSDFVCDTCGTGGDHSGTFNISTAAAFVVTGAGIPVAKHGNRSVTSKSGSADVLEKLGVNVNLGPDEASNEIKENNFAFLFAPNYHPAMRYVMPVRRELGMRTIFNILGPIVNPAGVKHHVMGVFKPELLDLIAPVFVGLGHKHSLVVHGSDGLDEATIAGVTYAREIKEGKITELEIHPETLGLDGSLENLRVNNADESAAVIEAILQGKENGDPRKAVVLNAALVIYVCKDVDIEEAVKIAEKSINSGSAYVALENARSGVTV